MDRYIKEMYRKGSTHMSIEVYYDTDSVIDSRDTTLCMYDYAKDILNMMGGGKHEKHR